MSSHIDRAWEIVNDPRLTGTAKRTDALLDLTEAAHRAADQDKAACRWWKPWTYLKARSSNGAWLGFTAELQENERIRSSKERRYRETAEARAEAYPPRWVT